MYLLLCEISYYNSMWSYFSVGPLYHYRQCRQNFSQFLMANSFRATKYGYDFKIKALKNG